MDSTFSSALYVYYLFTSALRLLGRFAGDNINYSVNRHKRVKFNNVKF